MSRYLGHNIIKYRKNKQLASDVIGHALELITMSMF